MGDNENYNNWFDSNNKDFFSSFQNFISSYNSEDQGKINEQINNTMKESIKSWKAFVEKDKEKNIDDFSDIFSEILTTSYNNLNKNFSILNDNINKTFESHDSGKLDAVLSFVKNLYESEISKVFSLPQIGLSRAYQEKINQTLDKYLIFQTSVYEFIYMLYIPIEQTLEFLKDNAEFSAGFTLEDDRIYEKWLALLEKNYMNLFHSEKYNKVFSKTVESLSEFRTARNDIVQDVLKVFGVPVNKDMDELYKEIYNLKKRINSLEKNK